MPRAKKQHLTRRKDGRYACRYKGKWFMGSTEDEALKARERYKAAEQRGELSVPRNITVQQYAATWLPLHRSGVTPKVYNTYANYLDKLTPVIGKKRLSDVTVDDAARVWVAHKWTSAQYSRNARGLYAAMFDSAVENDLCRKNPFRSKQAQPPKLPDGTHRALTQEEISLVLATPHRCQLAALVMLYAGLRSGEVAALTMDDIDLDAGIIHVNKAVRYEHNHPTIVRPKTAAGIRDVPIFAALRPYLTNRIGKVLSADGKQMSRGQFVRSIGSYNRALSAAAGHPVHIRCHDFRHTYCTMLRDAGVDIKQAMRWMGHADEKMILRIYDHLTEERAQNSIDQVEKMLSCRQNGRQNISGAPKDGAV